jgi:hypothetical protein
MTIIMTLRNSAVLESTMHPTVLPLRTPDGTMTPTPAS